MGKTFHFLTNPINIPKPNTGVWEDHDLDDHIAGLGADVTGVILHFRYASGGVTWKYRKKGSTDDRSHNYVYRAWALCGVYANHVFEVYRGGNVTSFDICGYTTTGVEFFTNGYDKSLAATGAWLDVDCGAQCPAGTKALIFEFLDNAAGYSMGFRNNGSTDNRTQDGRGLLGVIIGCDANRVCEHNIGNVAQDNFLLGYATDEVEMYVNAPDISCTITGAYQDRTLPAATVGKTIGALIEHISTAITYTFNVREKGSTWDHQAVSRQKCWALCGCDAARMIQGIVASLAVDFFLVGIATETIVGIGSKGPNMAHRLVGAGLI
jgi:hypothetical protein